MRTVIRGGWVVAHDGATHRLVKDAVVVVDDDQITEIVSEYRDRADEELDAPDCIVSPGFIDVHVHPGTWQTDRTINDNGRRVFMGNSFLEHALSSPTGRRTPGDFRFEGDEADQARASDDVGALFTQIELLSNGITTFVDAGTRASYQRAHARVADRLGMRAYLAPGYQSSLKVGRPNGSIERDYDYENYRGKQELVEAEEFIREYDGTQDGRIRGMLYPRETEFCNQEFFARTRQLADELRVPIQTHAAYSAADFYYCVDRFGMTPIELLEHWGVLGPDLTVAHTRWIAESNLTNWQDGRDLELLRDTRTSVTLGPIVSARRGVGWDLQMYVDAGVNVSICNDTYPRDLIQNMRQGSYQTKQHRRSLFSAPAEMLYDCITVNPANSLGRDDLGRICPGAKADITIISTRPRGSLRWGVVRDPIKSLLDTGMGDDVRTVLIDGKVAMRDRQIDGVDIDELLSNAQTEAEDFWDHLQEWDPLGRTAAEKCPWSFTPWELEPAGDDLSSDR